MTWKDAPIDGCLITPLKKFADARGWLIEFFRRRNQAAVDRGEYEVSDVSTAYVRLEQLTYGVLDGWWGDAGTLEGWHEANELARDLVYEE